MTTVMQHRKRILIYIAWFMVLSFVNLIIGCNYYKVRTFESLTEEMSRSELQKYQNLNKYLILHYGSTSYHLSVDKLDADRQMLYCYVEKTPSEHQMYHPNSKGSMQYKSRKGEDIITHEVHIFASGINLKENNVQIPLKSITRIDVIDTDTGRSAASHIFGTLGVVAGVLTILIIIIALTKSSCPFVYVKNGTAYEFKGEIYGGAIFKPLQRNDYLFLKTINETDSVINIRISNELKEIQYTDVAEIVIAEHSSGIQTMIDNFGSVHALQKAVTPQMALLNGQQDITYTMKQADSSSCLFNSDGQPDNMNQLLLRFAMPQNAKQAKLILNAKNTLFLDFAFTQFTKLFGIRYNDFIKKQNKANRDSLLQWSINQGLPLAVYVMKNNDWKLIEYINTPGPLAARNICVPIDVSNLASNTLEIKLACGYMFWEVDYAAVDYSTDDNIKTITLKPDKAIEQNGNDVTNLLSHSDNNYLIQYKPGNSVDITYRLSNLDKRKSHDVYLMTNGYYQHVRDYTGLPDKNYLMSFKQKGAFINFAKQLQEHLIENNLMANSK